MTLFRRGSTLVLVAGLTCALGTVPTASSAEPARATVQTAPVVAKAKPEKPEKEEDLPFNPKTGLRLNDPVKPGRARFRGFEQVFKSIEDSVYPSHIDVATWNFDSPRLVDALTRAHLRGVRVRLIMQGNMANRQSRATGSFWRLKRNLTQPRLREKREAVGKSWARACKGSCRGGKGGILHSKFYLFSQVSQTPNVVVLSSGNLTEYSATVQWNDTYTVANRPDVYNAFAAVFAEMAKDKRVRPPYRFVQEDPALGVIFMPYKGPAATPKEPVLQRLDGVQCVHNLPDVGFAGVTVIKVAQTAWMDDRGAKIARRMRDLYAQGCDIQVIYAVMPIRIQKILNRDLGRGAVPRQEITQDLDGDGVYDRYLHMKVLTIDGVRGGVPSQMVWNGSENWNKVSLNSDEAGLQIASKPLVDKYNNWINQLFLSPPVSSRPALNRMIGPVDPYSKIEID